MVATCLFIFLSLMSSVHAFDVLPNAATTTTTTAPIPTPTPSPSPAPSPSPDKWRDGKIELAVEKCFYFSASRITFQTDHSVTSQRLFDMYGVPSATVDQNECIGIPNPRMRHFYLNYTTKASTELAFTFLMTFTHDGTNLWTLSGMEFANVTKGSSKLVYVFSKTLQKSNDLYGYSEQSYQCDHLSYMGDYKSSSISFDTLRVQAFDIDGNSPSSNIRYCDDSGSTPTEVVAIVVGCIVGAFVVFAAATLAIILLYRRCRYKEYSLLES